MMDIGYFMLMKILMGASLGCLGTQKSKYVWAKSQNTHEPKYQDKYGTQQTKYLWDQRSKSLQYTKSQLMGLKVKILMGPR